MYKPGWVTSIMLKRLMPLAAKCTCAALAVHQVILSGAGCGPGP